MLGKWCDPCSAVIESLAPQSPGVSWKLANSHNAPVGLDKEIRILDSIDRGFLPLSCVKRIEKHEFKRELFDFRSKF